jgi:tetratricopeptide (TPR) repeat protein
MQSLRKRAGKEMRSVGVLGLWLICVGGQSLPAQQTTAQTNTKQGASGSAEFAEAKTLLEQGSTAEAKTKIQEQLRKNPNSVEGYNLLGILYSREKDYPNAQEAFEHAVKLDPKSARSLNNLGDLYVAEGKLDLAEKQYRAAVLIAPTNRDANYNLGVLLLSKGSASKSILYFERVRPVDAATQLNLARAYLQAGRTAEGLKLANEISSKGKEDAQLHVTLGLLLAGEKQYRAAASEMEKANALHPDAAEILYALGEAYLQAGDYAKAEVALRRALKGKPESADILHGLGQVYWQQNKPVDALEVLVHAHKLAPENTDIIFLLARVSMSQNYFEDAIPLLESGIKIAPQRGDLYAALGESYFMSGKTEKATEEFKKLIELIPSAGSYAFMGLAYRHLGRFDEARKYFEEGLRKDPRNISCLFNLGYIEERQGNHVKAEQLFQQVLRLNPNFPEALIELANLKIANKKFEEAAELLRRYVKVSREPASGYYKLAMVERSLQQTEASQRDLSVFQTLSKDAKAGPYPYEHLFDYVDNRSSLSPQARTEMDLKQLTDAVNTHPDQPQNLYLLAEAYLKLGKTDEARTTIKQLDQISGTDYQTQAGLGVLFARFHLYDDAIQHFQKALAANADSDDVKFDLADAYFRKGAYKEALSAAQQVSAKGQQDDAYLSLVGDIHAHLGDLGRAAKIFQDAIQRNPDNDQYYLSLSMIEIRQNDLSGAKKTLQEGRARVAGSGKLLWGLGLVAVLEGKTAEAEEHFQRAVELLPEWSGSYSTLGIFYYQTGQIVKAREVLNRFKGSSAAGGIDLNRIEEALSKAPATTASATAPMPVAARQQLVQFALVLADRTL